MSAAQPAADTGFRHRCVLGSEAEMSRLAAALAPALGAGDTLLLEGPIGAGKTFFARALIAARLASAGAPAEEIPSPTFTLVQTYSAGGLEIWHADLYRLSAPGEVTELGLEEAFEAALCLVEWPERLGPLRPPGALGVAFEIGEGETERRVTLFGPAFWGARLRRALERLDA